MHRRRVRQQRRPTRMTKLSVAVTAASTMILKTAKNRAPGRRTNRPTRSRKTRDFMRRSEATVDDRGARIWLFATTRTINGTLRKKLELRWSLCLWNVPRLKVLCSQSLENSITTGTISRSVKLFTYHNMVFTITENF